MADALRLALEKLVDIYSIAGEQLHQPQIQRALRNQRCMDDEFEACVRLLDVCAAAREAVSSLRLHAQDLQSAFRTKRRVTTATLAYRRATRAVREEGARFSKILKQLRRKRGGSPGGEGEKFVPVMGLTEAAIGVFLCLSSVLMSQAPEKTKREATVELQRQLQRSERELDGLEARLEAAFRVLIRQSVLLLNVLN
ncbi:uncharacterized protein LOC144715339 [Wolffia australiana]